MGDTLWSWLVIFSLLQISTMGVWSWPGEPPRATTNQRYNWNPFTPLCPQPVTKMTPKYQIESMLTDWTSSVKVEMTRKFLEVSDKFEKLEKERQSKIKLPQCPDTTRALDILLDKMSKELSHFNVTQNGPVHPSTSLQTLEQFRTRSVYFGWEVRTEPVNECSRYLREKLEQMTYGMNQMENELKTRVRGYLVMIVVRHIASGNQEGAALSLRSVGPHELDLTLRDIVITLLPETRDGILDIRHFNSILSFIRHVGSTAPPIIKTTIELVIDILQKHHKLDTQNFLTLAYEAKMAIGAQLKEKFPAAVQNLIWGLTNCIKNQHTNLYLLERSPAPPFVSPIGRGIEYRQRHVEQNRNIPQNYKRSAQYKHQIDLDTIVVQNAGSTGDKWTPHYDESDVWTSTVPTTHDRGQEQNYPTSSSRKSGPPLMVTKESAKESIVPDNRSRGGQYGTVTQLPSQSHLIPTVDPNNSIDLPKTEPSDHPLINQSETIRLGQQMEGISTVQPTEERVRNMPEPKDVSLEKYHGRVIETRMPRPATQTEEGESCGWEIHPVVGSATATSSLRFIIRRKVESDWGWNLNSENERVWLSPASINPEFQWEILPEQNATSFLIKSFKNSAINPRMDSMFLCSNGNGGVGLDRLKYSTCHWFLEVSV